MIAETFYGFNNLEHWPETTQNKNEIFSNHVMFELENDTHAFFNCDSYKWHRLSQAWEKIGEKKEKENKGCTSSGKKK